MIVVTTKLTNIPITLTNDSATSGLLAMYLLLKSVIRLVMVNVINKNESKYKESQKKEVMISILILSLTQTFPGESAHLCPQIVIQ